MNGGRQFHETVPISRTDALRDLGSGEVNRVAHTLICVALHEPDLTWAQAQCERFADHADPEVRGAVVTCLGHLARIHRKLDLSTAARILHRLVNDPEIAGRAEDAIDDIQQFMDCGRSVIFKPRIHPDHQDLSEPGGPV